MDDSSLLSSRSAAMDALSTLSASHARLLSLAASLVDRLFPGDGSIRDEAILPFANLAFIAVGKARADLDTYSKSFEGVIKTIDTIRPPPPSAQITAPAVPILNGQTESVGVLKRKYEEGMAAAPQPVAASPKKGVPAGAQKRPATPKGTASVGSPNPGSPKLSTASGGSASQLNIPAPVETAASSESAYEHDAHSEIPASESTSHATQEEPQHTEPAPEVPAPAPTATPTLVLPARSSAQIIAPKPVIELDNPIADDFASPFDLPTVAGVPQSPRRPIATYPASADPELSSSDPTSSQSPSSREPSGKQAMKKVLEGMVLPNRKKPSFSAATPPPTTASPSAVTETAAPATASPDQSEDSKGKRKSDTGTAGTSDDDISSDEEEYLRGVEERRQRAQAEKEERVKAAKEAKEARQNMYAFLTEEPPPGFVTVKTTAPTTAKKTKKDKKDKARDRLASKGSVPEDASSEKKAQGSHSSPSGTPKRMASPTGSTPRNVSDLDLSSSPSASTTNPNLHQLTSRTGSGTLTLHSDSWTTRYRPAGMADPLAWSKAEQTILNDPPPTKKRWEEYQAKYHAKADAAASAENKKPSVAGFKSVSLKNLRKERSVTSGGRDTPPVAPDSPRRKSNADDSSPRKSLEDSPADSSTAPSTTEERRAQLRHSDSVNRKPLPKLESVGDPRIFLFEAPVTEANLRFMEKNGEEVLSGGTMEKLIQHLTSAAEPSPEYFQCFMLTYHNFLTPKELIELLRLRWNSQPSDPAKLDTFVSQHLFPIRLRIVNVLRLWIESFGSDFKDEAAVEALKSFTEYIRQEYPQMADLVSSKLKKYLAGHIRDEEGEIDEDPPITHPLAEGREFNPSLTDIHPEEFARQMTLVEHALFKAIPYKELLTNGKAGKSNPNVANMISYTNHLVNWVGTQIVKHEDVRMRAVTLARFITIAKFCIISCQNYNGAMEILSALRSSTIFRLKHTWNMLPDSVWDDYEWLEDLFESDNNYARYRKALSNAVPPCVPYLGRYLSEMLFLNEIHPDCLAQGPPPIINFAKMMLVADIMHHMQRYQKSPFCLTGIPIVQKFFLLKRGVLNEKDLYKVSLEREPRDTPVSPTQ